MPWTGTTFKGIWECIKTHWSRPPALISKATTAFVFFFSINSSKHSNIALIRVPSSSSIDYIVLASSPFSWLCIRSKYLVWSCGPAGAFDDSIQRRERNRCSKTGWTGERGKLRFSQCTSTRTHYAPLEQIPSISTGASEPSLCSSRSIVKKRQRHG